MMNCMPKRIAVSGISLHAREFAPGSALKSETEYVRADIHDAEIARLRQDLRDMRSEFESATERAASAHVLYNEAAAARDAALAKIAAHNERLNIQCDLLFHQRWFCNNRGDQTNVCERCPRRDKIEVAPCA